MKFRIIIEGKYMGFIPVRLTPVDVVVRGIAMEAARALVTAIGKRDLNQQGFKGSVRAEIKAAV